MIDRQFDYAQRILLAVEFAPAPRQLTDMPDSYSVFQRLPIPEVVQAFNQAMGPLVRLIAGRKFRHVLHRHMGYWESRIPTGQQCYVHYAIGTQELVNGMFDRLKAASPGWIMLGIYHLEPQGSAFPFGFPANPVPDQWSLGQARTRTPDSIFWFNFFPAQNYLFEKTFVVCAMFCLLQLKERGECNQLCAWDGKDRLQVAGVDEFVQVNLNRFTSLSGFFNSAREAGKHTFTADPDYLWYGMLLRQL
jgi:hypothetical protein